MIIKRYLVDNMNEAMVRIRYELGSDAVIVSQRKIRQKGIAGFFKPRKIEVTAAADDKVKKVKETIEKKEEIEKEITELKGMLQNLLNQKENTQKRDSKNKTRQKLIENDVPQEVIEAIYDRIKANTGDKKLTAKAIEKEIKNAAEEIIKIDKNNECRIHVLVGPTGVGKTTTIAKLASMYSIYKNKKVGLITIDTYRIGAVEQLKTYAEILDVPFGVIISSRDIPQVLDKMKDCDIIFVDTTGRNSKNIMQISETRKYIESLKADKVHLVLSMTTKQKDIKNVIENFKVINYNSIILTKIDETEVYGSVLTSAYYSNAPISYITTGQNVPEDIEEAKHDRLLKLVLGAEN